MSMEETRKHFKFMRSARNWGISALAAATIGGYALYQHSAASANALQPIQTSAFNVLAQATPESTPGTYIDGDYTGDSVQAGHWGSMQVTVVIENGQIANFKINDYPHSTSTSLRISQIAIPYLMQETIQAQTASIDIVSRATLTSEAFTQSLQSALDDASVGMTATPAPNTTGTAL